MLNQKRTFFLLFCFFLKCTKIITLKQVEVFLFPNSDTHTTPSSHQATESQLCTVTSHTYKWNFITCEVKKNVYIANILNLLFLFVNLTANVCCKILFFTVLHTYPVLYIPSQVTPKSELVDICYKKQPHSELSWFKTVWKMEKIPARCLNKNSSTLTRAWKKKIFKRPTEIFMVSVQSIFRVKLTRWIWNTLDSITVFPYNVK